MDYIIFNQGVGACKTTSASYVSIVSNHLLQGCATCITLGARSSQNSGTKKASDAKLICYNRQKNVLGHYTHPTRGTHK